MCQLSALPPLPPLPPAEPPCRRKGPDPQLLGFFWTATHQLVLVTGAGLEVHRVQQLPPAACQALRLEGHVAVPGVQWYAYSPQTHMVVLGFGSSGAKLQVGGGVCVGV